MSVLLEGAGVFFGCGCLANVVVRSFWNISHKAEAPGPFFRAPAITFTSGPFFPWGSKSSSRGSSRSPNFPWEAIKKFRPSFRFEWAKRDFWQS